MQGIRTYFRPWRDAGFRQAYECLYPLFGGLWFYLYRGDCIFRFPWDDEERADRFDSSAIDRDDAGNLYSVTSLIANDVYISDDWNGITLTDTKELATNRRVYEAIHSLPPKRYEFKGRILFFHNFDGAFWQFFSNDAIFMTRVLESHSRNPAFDLRLVDYERDYPDPGRYSEDYPLKAEQ